MWGCYETDFLPIHPVEYKLVLYDVHIVQVSKIVKSTGEREREFGPMFLIPTKKFTSYLPTWLSIFSCQAKREGNKDVGFQDIQNAQFFYNSVPSSRTD